MCADRQAAEVIARLRERGWHATAAESCTGGMIAAEIISVPGASDVWEESYVTYCDRAKHRLLGVREETLRRYTAVSRQTALEMAEGAARRAEAECSVSATGLAGPGGGTVQIPVGTVFLGCHVPGATVAEEHHFSGDREAIRRQAADEAIRLLLRYLTRENDADR